MIPANAALDCRGRDTQRLKQPSVEISLHANTSIKTLIIHVFFEFAVGRISRHGRATYRRAACGSNRRVAGQTKSPATRPGSSFGRSRHAKTEFDERSLRPKPADRWHAKATSPEKTTAG